MQNIATFTFSDQAQAAETAVHSVMPLVGLTLVGVDLTVNAFTGTPTNMIATIKQGSTTLATLTATTAGTSVTWKSAHVGGANAAVACAAGTKVQIDISFTGGTSPTADYDVTLWCLPASV